MAVMLTVALITVALFLLSVVFFPSVGKKRKIKIYSLIPLVGAVLMIAVGACIIAPMIENYTFSLPEFARAVSIDGEELGIYLPFFAAFMLLLLLDIKLRAIQRKKFNE